MAGEQGYGQIGTPIADSISGHVSSTTSFLTEAKHLLGLSNCENKTANLYELRSFRKDQLGSPLISTPLLNDNSYVFKSNSTVSFDAQKTYIVSFSDCSHLSLRVITQGSRI